LWAWLEFFFPPLKGTNFKTTYLLPYFFQLNTLEGTAKAHNFGGLKTLRGSQTAFFYPFNKGTSSKPALITWDSPPRKNAVQFTASFGISTTTLKP